MKGSKLCTRLQTSGKTVSKQEINLARKLLAGVDGTGEPTLVRRSFVIKKVNDEKQIVTGEVYAPNVIDSHGDMMLPDDVEELCYKFLAQGLNDHIDIMHNNKPALATAVESFIARGMPEYNEGAWVMSVKIYDQDLWADVKAGKYSGYSMEVMIKAVPAVVEITVQRSIVAISEKNDGHDHAVYLMMNDDGRVIKGWTSWEGKGKNRHRHEIIAGTATEFALDHSHRFKLR